MFILSTQTLEMEQSNKLQENAIIYCIYYNLLFLFTYIKAIYGNFQLYAHIWGTLQIEVE